MHWPQSSGSGTRTRATETEARATPRRHPNDTSSGTESKLQLVIYQPQFQWRAELLTNFREQTSSANNLAQTARRAAGNSPSSASQSRRGRVCAWGIKSNHLISGHLSIGHSQIALQSTAIYGPFACADRRVQLSIRLPFEWPISVHRNDGCKYTPKFEVFGSLFSLSLSLALSNALSLFFCRCATDHDHHP